MHRGGRFLARDGWNLIQEGIHPSGHADLYVLGEGVMGYACHREMDPKLIKQLQGALDELNADGSLERIIRQYREQSLVCARIFYGFA
jgi:hypothetical protein